MHVGHTLGSDFLFKGSDMYLPHFPQDAAGQANFHMFDCGVTGGLSRTFPRKMSLPRSCSGGILRTARTLGCWRLISLVVWKPRPCTRRLRPSSRSSTVSIVVPPQKAKCAKTERCTMCRASTRARTTPWPKLSALSRTCRRWMSTACGNASSHVRPRYDGISGWHS